MDRMVAICRPVQTCNSFVSTCLANHSIDAHLMEDMVVGLAFDRTFRGLLYRRYRDMKARVNGCPHKRAKTKGMELLSQKEFFDWAFSNLEYTYLWADWVRSGYNTLLAPSIDRLDSTKGYIIGNMQWLTWEDHQIKHGRIT